MKTFRQIIQESMFSTTEMRQHRGDKTKLLLYYTELDDDGQYDNIESDLEDWGAGHLKKSNMGYHKEPTTGEWNETDITVKRGREPSTKIEFTLNFATEKEAKAVLKKWKKS